MSALTDLPINVHSGDIRYELEQPLDRLQRDLNRKNIDIDTLDARTESNRVILQNIETKQYSEIQRLTDNNPEMDITSRRVRDLNDMFDKNLINANPNYIFRDDVRTRNNVGTIQRGIKSFVADRDLYVTPPSVDTDQKILDLLENKL